MSITFFIIFLTYNKPTEEEFFMNKLKPINREFNRQVGIILRDARKQKGISQYRLSELTNIPRSNIAQYELGNSSVPLENFIKLCHTLDLDANTCLKDIPL